MLQLDIVDPANPTQLAYPDKLRTQLTKLKSVGVVGVMCDFWWGVVEQQPGQYVWSAYLQLAEMCVDIGLKFNVVASFHQCGGNVGDSCNIRIIFIISFIILFFFIFIFYFLFFIFYFYFYFLFLFLFLFSNFIFNFNSYSHSLLG
mgnify:CR=1 FL=1